MPGYKGHLLGGIVFFILSMAGILWLGIYRPDLPTTLLLLSVTLLGALFPDTDTDSKGQNLFYGCLVVIDLGLMIAGAYKWAAVLGFSAMLPAVGHHRGWTHTWWAMLLVPVPILLLPVLFFHHPLERLLPFYLAAVLGYLSHLVLDRKM